jgi:DNA-binding XRE family transcriptional regulator
MLAVWLSVASYDRGEVKTRADLADLMSVSRQTTYGWEAKQPVREWAELLRLRRMRGSHLAEVDERTYVKAIGEESSASDRKLYYQRAGVWEDEQRLHLVGAEDGPVEYADVNDGELEAIRQALITQAKGGGEEG